MPPAGSIPILLPGIGVGAVVTSPPAVTRASMHVPVANHALPSGATATSCAPGDPQLEPRDLAARVDVPGLIAGEPHAAARVGRQVTRVGQLDLDLRRASRPDPDQPLAAVVGEPHRAVGRALQGPWGRAAGGLELGVAAVGDLGAGVGRRARGGDVRGAVAARCQAPQRAVGAGAQRPAEHVAAARQAHRRELPGRVGADELAFAEREPRLPVRAERATPEGVVDARRGEAPVGRRAPDRAAARAGDLAPTRRRRRPPSAPRSSSPARRARRHPRALRMRRTRLPRRSQPRQLD